jgi:NADPH2:quinone reductase
MKAIAIDQYGGRDQLKFREMPTPEPGPGEVRIRIRAAGVNPVDWKIREGLFRTRLPNLFPIIPGYDCAGVIEARGPGANAWGIGEEVFAYARKPVVSQGAYAEYIVLPEVQVASKPQSLSFEEAASMPLAGMTAWQSLFSAGGLRAGQSVLIQAGAGGVGGFAIQLAKARGAAVIATASARNHDYVRSLGADAVVDYTAGDFRAAVRAWRPEGVDLAFDTVGGEVQPASADVVRPGGTLVSILALQDHPSLRRADLAVRYVFAAPQAAQLALMGAMADAGALRTRLAAVIPLAEAARAQELIETRHVAGKIVLRVD